MVIIIVGLLAIPVAIILIIASLKPGDFRTERKIVISAPPEKVFPWLEDPRLTAQWSPWEKKDPNIKKTYSGAPKGVGAVYEWDGNNDVGAGRLEITEAVAPKKVVMDLRFFRPMKGHNVAEYSVTPRGDGTSEVSWSIRGPAPLMHRVMCVFMDMDKMIGDQFEKGLADLKTLAEK